MTDFETHTLRCERDRLAAVAAVVSDHPVVVAVQRVEGGRVDDHRPTGAEAGFELPQGLGIVVDVFQDVDHHDRVVRRAVNGVGRIGLDYRDHRIGCEAFAEQGCRPRRRFGRRDMADGGEARSECAVACADLEDVRTEVRPR